MYRNPTRRSCRLEAQNRLHDERTRLFTISPSSELHPFPALKILIVAKEVLDLITKDRRQIGQLADIIVERIQLVDRHGNNLFVNTVFSFPQQRAYRAVAYDGARRDRYLRKHHAITSTLRRAPTSALSAAIPPNLR